MSTPIVAKLRVGCIVIGRDAARGIGRLYYKSWVPENEYFYTKCCNLPIQGVWCADASMLAPRLC